MAAFKLSGPGRRLLLRQKRRRTLQLAGLIGLILLALGGFWYFFGANNNSPLKNSRTFSRQSEVFAGWYEDQQKNIGQLDRNWQKFHRILSDFTLDIISIEESYLRLTALTEAARETAAAVKKNVPPLSLEGDTYDLTAIVYHRTLDYATAQLAAIENTAKAADLERFTRRSQEEKSRLLRETAVRFSPAGLFTEKEISRLREILRNP